MLRFPAPAARTPLVVPSALWIARPAAAGPSGSAQQDLKAQREQVNTVKHSETIQSLLPLFLRPW